MEHYYIYCLHNENLPEYYVGHTKNWRNRWDKHKQDSKISSCKVYKYINNNGGIDNFKMEILYECYCLEIEARQYEKYYKNLLGATLNTQEPGRTRKEYRDLNNPIYYENNKEQILEQKKEYYQNNKEIILEKQGIKFNCICGSTTTHNHQARHFKTEKHINFIRENIGY